MTCDEVCSLTVPLLPTQLIYLHRSLALTYIGSAQQASSYLLLPKRDVSCCRSHVIKQGWLSVGLIYNGTQRARDVKLGQKIYVSITLPWIYDV
jgi:hypothetical protein